MGHQDAVLLSVVPAQRVPSACNACLIRYTQIALSTKPFASSTLGRVVVGQNIVLLYGGTSIRVV